MWIKRKWIILNEEVRFVVVLSKKAASFEAAF